MPLRDKKRISNSLFVGLQRAQADTKKLIMENELPVCRDFLDNDLLEYLYLTKSRAIGS